ncbi:MAG TPA: DUF5302 domain-containing protein [Sporichthyaceae bacterium]|nr:DUF5302 domain-containing protein [Sporichthyaceae bacterium]
MDETQRADEPQQDEPETDEPEAEEGPDVFAGDDPKAKFREALARKGGQGGGAGQSGGGGSKVGSAHGPAKASRTFRRKSGG